jgi:hypothetical protein
MKYKVESDGSITCGSQVVMRHPENASANMIAEALQDAADRAYKQAVEDSCERLHGLLNDAPDENRPAVMQRSTNHGRRVGE